MRKRIGYGIRQLRKNPGTTILAILILALSIGANTALFTVTDSVLLQPLSYQQPDRIVAIGNGNLQAVGLTSWVNYDELSKRSKSYDDIAAFMMDGPIVHTPNSSELVTGIRTTANLFDVLRIHPISGRVFTNDDSRPGALPVVLITNSFWREYLSSDPDIVGKQIRVGETLHTVIGLLPRGLRFPDFMDSDSSHGIWLPLPITQDMLTQRSNNFLRMVGRLRPNVRIKDAQQEASAITANMNVSIGDSGGKVDFRVLPFESLVTGGSRPVLLALTASMCLLLLIACADVANLQLARFFSRTQEFALRTALGASQGELVKQVLSEVFVLCIPGSVLGLVLAWILLQLIRLLPEDTIVRSNEIHFRWEVIAVLAAITLLSTIFSALAPAILTARQDPQSKLSEAVGRSSSGVKRTRLASWLITGEVALAAMLLVATMLMFRTLRNLQNSALGFEPQQVTAFWAVPGASTGFIQRAQHDGASASILSLMYEPMLEQILQLPGVTSAAFTTAAPLGNISMQTGFTLVGQSDSVKNPPVLIRAVTSNYAGVLGTSLLQGRMISDSDGSNSQFVAVVNQAFVSRYLHDTDPIGKYLELGGASMGMVQPYMIVGVLANMVQNQVAQPPDPEVSIAYRQIPSTSTFFSFLVAPEATFVVRTRGNADIRSSIRNLFKTGAPGTALYKMQTLQEAQQQRTFDQRLCLYIVGGFAAVAVLLVIGGLYGVLSHLVGQRQKEFGVRMALGASRGDILALVAKRGMLMILVGSAAGLIASVATNRLIASFLYGVKPGDPISYVAVVLMLTLIGCAAILAPAYRASRLEPFRTLRAD